MLSNIASSVAIESARIHFPLVAGTIIQRTEGNDPTILQEMLDALLDQRSNEDYNVRLYLGTYQNDIGERAMAHINILDEIKTMLEAVQLDNVQTMSQAETDHPGGSVQPITLGNVQVFGLWFPMLSSVNPVKILLNRPSTANSIQTAFSQCAWTACGP